MNQRSENRSELEAALGKHPFAYVPRDLARSGKNLGHNAVALYALLSALSDDYGGAHGSASHLARMIAGSTVSVQRWLIELREAQCIDYYAPSGECNRYNLGYSRKELIEAGAFLRAPLIAWDKPWRPLDRRVWLVLWSYANKNGVCYPSVKRLCHDCGVQLRRVQESLYRLRGNDLVEQVYRHKQTTLYTLRKHDGRSKEPSESADKCNSPRSSARNSYNKNSPPLRHERHGTNNKSGRGVTSNLAGRLHQTRHPILSHDLDTEQEIEHENDHPGAVDMANGASIAADTIECDAANPTELREGIKRLVEQLRINRASDATGSFEARRADQLKGLKRLDRTGNRPGFPGGSKP